MLDMFVDTAQTRATMSDQLYKLYKLLDIYLMRMKFLNRGSTMVISNVNGMSAIIIETFVKYRAGESDHV